MNWNSGRRNQRQHSGNNQNGGRSERNQGRMRSGFKGGRAGGRAGGRGRSTSRNPSRRTETEVKRVKRVPLLRSETQATVKGEAVVAANVLDTPTIVLLRRAG